jgi:hypothetical protein
MVDLTAMHKLGYSRIPNISYVGKVGPLETLVASEIFFELHSAYTLGKRAIGFTIVAGGTAYHYLVITMTPELLSTERLILRNYQSSDWERVHVDAAFAEKQK